MLNQPARRGHPAIASPASAVPQLQDQDGAGKCDTLGAILILLALALFNLQEFTLANVLVSLKILAILAFVFVSSPTATHAITEAALIGGVEPWTKGGKRS